MWKEIKNWEGYYSVNEFGEVRNDITNKLLVGDKNSAGYYRVCLYNKNHKPSKQRFFRHRLVAMHFIDNPLDLPEVNHIDGDKANNTLKNLEWIDRKTNELHSRKYIQSKEYKPFVVIFNNGERIHFDVKPTLANMLNVTDAAVKNWLQGKSKGYKNFNIKDIYYV